ncbi:MAG: hypothetical protein ABI656_06995, partial [bacterium]
MSARYPPGSISTGEVAETALEQVATENSRIELEYAQAEQACRGQFFVSACRDKAKERRRAALESIHPLKIEAETVIRRIRVAERDQALTEKHIEKAAEAVQFEQNALKKTQEIAQKKARNAEKDRERSQKTNLHVQDDRSR